MGEAATNLSLAQSLARNGIPVFPCLEADGLALNKDGTPKGAKAPYIKAGFYAATTDADQIARWWAQWPNAVPGIPTGEATGLSVIDGDIDRDTGETIGEGQINALGLDALNAVKVRTASGGVHLIFKHAEGARVSSGQVASKVDTRGAGGYIIAPGSLMADGSRYSYEGRSLATALKAGDLPIYPVEAVNAAIEVSKPKANESKPSQVNGFDFAADDQTAATDAETTDVLRVLMAEAPNRLCREDWVKLAISLRVGYGETLRDDFINFSLGYQGGTTCTLEAAKHVWESSGNPHKITSIAPALALLKDAVGPDRFKAVYRDTFERSRDQAGNRKVETPSEAPDDQKPRRSRYKGLQTSGQFVASGTPPAYLVDGVMQRNRLCSLTGFTGHAKTTFSTLLTFCIATGEDLNGHEVEQGSVLFLAGENHDNVITQWHALLLAKGRSPDSVPVYFHPGNFSLRQHLDTLKADAAKIPNLALIIPDTFQAFFPGDDDNSNMQMLEAAQIYRDLLDLPTRPTVLVPTHPSGKQPDRKNLVPRGGGAFLNELDSNYTIWREDNVVTFHHDQQKHRGAPFDPMTFKIEMLSFDQIADAKGRQMPMPVARPMLKVEEIEAERAVENREAKVLAAIRDNPKISLRALEPIAGVKRTKLAKLLDEMKKDRLIREKARKRYLTDEGKEVLQDANL